MHQAAGIEQMDAPSPIRVGPQNVFELQCRLTKQRLCPLLLQGGQPAQQRLHGRAGNQRTVFAQHLRVVLQVAKQRFEVLEVQQQQAFAIGHLETGIQRRLLAIGELKQVA